MAATEGNARAHSREHGVDPIWVSPWLGAAAVAAAAVSSILAWHGGLWAAPVWVSLAGWAVWTARWRRAPRGSLQLGQAWQPTQHGGPGEPWQAWQPGGPGRRWAGPALAALALVVGVAGFASSGGAAPALRTESASYAPGETVGVRLKAGVQAVGYNLCAGYLTLERGNAGGWDPAPVSLFPETGGPWACTAQLLILPPLLAATGEVHLPSDLAPGRYRLTYEAEISGERRPLATAPFTVGA